MQYSALHQLLWHQDCTYLRARRNCLALLKKCYCAAAVVRGYRRGGGVIGWSGLVTLATAGGYRSVTVQRDLCAAWMEEAAAKLLTQSAANEKQLHEHTDSLSSLLTDRVLECMNVSKQWDSFTQIFCNVTVIGVLDFHFVRLETILRSTKRALEHSPGVMLTSV